MWKVKKQQSRQAKRKLQTDESAKLTQRCKILEKNSLTANIKEFWLRKKYESIDDCLNQFRRNIAVGPLFVCTCFHQTWIQKNRHSNWWQLVSRSYCNRGFKSLWWIDKNTEWNNNSLLEQENLSSLTSESVLDGYDSDGFSVIDSAEHIGDADTLVDDTHNESKHN